LSFTVIIPARYQASRFPGKLLQDLAGKPVLQHVHERASQSEADRVVVATDDRRIEDCCRRFGADVLLTSGEHRSGTDRLQEAAEVLGLDSGACVVNVQGDEPLIPAKLINQVANNLLQRPAFAMATLCELIDKPDELTDPNSVKVVFAANGQALYFSRAPIPHGAVPHGPSAQQSTCYRHLGIYAYRVELLNRFVSWPAADMELSERLEQLRALYNGAAIHVEVANTALPPGIDTPADLEAVRRFVADTATAG
jgi:3-deoxy-manno-octulosonate cytidylyltransferase (CMP-KDO synthetase)